MRTLKNGKKVKILVTGASGQLGSCIQELIRELQPKEFDYTFRSSEFDISESNLVAEDFTANGYDYCVNCAAYTHVDKAESNRSLARKVNIEGPKSLALACKKTGTTLIHISTDFVFDGTATVPYSETDFCRPLGVYGQTKLDGEIKIKSILKKYFIIRTSWLYSEYGNNFMKKIIELGNQYDQLSVVNDQHGTPTYAKDLGLIILMIVASQINDYGTYHFSNEGKTTWYGFAKKIFEISKREIPLRPIPTKEFPTPAKRPGYSVLDKSKIKKTLDVSIGHWEERLIEAMDKHKRTDKN